MKKYKLILTIVLLLLGYVSIKSAEFEISAIQTHFVGCLGAKNRLIIYGTGGTIWISTDKGNSWYKKEIYPFGTIRKIVNQNDTLWGIMDEGIVLMSIDLGINWVQYKIGLNADDFFANLVVHSDYLYIRTKNKILMFDKKINPVGYIEDSTLTVSKTDFFFLGSFKGPAYYIYNDAEMFETPHFLIANIGKPLLDEKGINHFCIINYNFDTIRFIDVKPFILKRPLDFDPGSISSVQILNDSLLITFGDPPIPYVTDFNFSHWRCFFKDTLLWKTDSILNRLSKGSYLFTGSDLLAGFYSTSSNYLYLGGLGIGYKPRDLGICNYQRNDEKEFFSIKGNLFENKFYVYPLNPLLASRLSMALVFKPGRFVQMDSIFFFVGPFKTIVRVDNNFRNWELISSLNSQPRSFINDSILIFLNLYNKSFDIDCSLDSGNTFIPTTLGLNQERFVVYNVDSLFNIIDSTVRFEKVTYLSSFKSLPIFYVDTTGVGFLVGSLGNIDISGYMTFGITLDFFKTIKFVKAKNISNLHDASNVFSWNNKLCFYSTSIDRDTLRALFHYFSPNEINYSSDTLNTEYFNLFFKFVHPNYVWRSGNEFYVFSIIQDSSMLFKKTACIYETNHPFSLTTPQLIIDDQIVFLQFYVINSDSILFVTSYPLTLYLFDRKNFKLINLFTSETHSKLHLVELNGNFFLFTDNGYLENTNRSDLTQWQEGKWDYGKPNFESVIFKGNVAIAGLSDSLRPFNYYKITLKKDTATNVEENRVEVRYYTTHFYATEPYPLPAHSIVKSKLYWDGSFDLHQAIDGVYDTMGNKIEGKERITLKDIGKATAEMLWECSGVPAGVYFIVIRHNGRADTIPIIVE